MFIIVNKEDSREISSYENTINIEDLRDFIYELLHFASQLRERATAGLNTNLVCIQK